MYFKHPAIQPTPGLAFEAFNPRLRNPMLPQQGYRPEAAGPEFLSMDGTDRVYMQALRSRNPVTLRGLGMDLNQLLTDQVGQFIDAAIERAWPKIQTKLDASTKPLRYMMGGILAVSVIGATLSYLAWSKSA